MLVGFSVQIRGQIITVVSEVGFVTIILSDDM